VPNIAEYANSDIVLGMKKDIHPKNYRTVIFHDNSSGERFLIGSTVATTETDKWKDGKEYPIAYVDVSSASHPFYTGQEKVMDTAGRVERFKARAEKTKIKSRTKKS
jgi:large subunit ribosomal protein L31